MMKKRALMQILAGLVEECGYETVRRVLEQNQPAKPESAKVATKKNNRPKNPKSGKSRPNAITAVESLALTGGEKKRVLERLAEKYEQKAFMPNVNHVRIFLSALGVDVSRIKSRQNATVRVFKHLAEMPQDELLEIESSGRYGPPKRLADIAEAIHTFGKHQRERGL